MFPLFRERSNRGGFISEQKNKRNNPYGRLTGTSENRTAPTQQGTLRKT
jgi:hypothetical protein